MGNKAVYAPLRSGRHPCGDVYGPSRKPARRTCLRDHCLFGANIAIWGDFHIEFLMQFAHPAGTRKEILGVETPEEIADELTQIFKEADWNV